MLNRELRISINQLLLIVIDFYVIIICVLTRRGVKKWWRILTCTILIFKMLRHNFGFFGGVKSDGKY